VDWPGGSFWPEITGANPNALVLLSVRDPESWYRSASNTIFLMFDNTPPEMALWMDAVRTMMHDRFCDRFDDPTAMMDAFERHNDAVRAGVSPSRLLEWNLGDGWDPICERLGKAVPSGVFPVTNSTNEFREMTGLSPLF
jgi:Sulfotransferase domain